MDMPRGGEVTVEEGEEPPFGFSSCWTTLCLFSSFNISHWQGVVVPIPLMLTGCFLLCENWLSCVTASRPCFSSPSSSPRLHASNAQSYCHSIGWLFIFVDVRRNRRTSLRFAAHPKMTNPRVISIYRMTFFQSECFTGAKFCRTFARISIFINIVFDILIGEHINRCALSTQS